MAEEQLIISARPKTLDGLVGQKKTVEAIRRHFKTNRIIKNWLFSGPKGTGKTSCARILALSYQCTHQEVFGKPCAECRANEGMFPILEINAAEATGKDAIAKLLTGAEYSPQPMGAYRVYILDEVQRASSAAQDMLLKYLENTPKTTIFILCTTAPQLLDETLQSRCTKYDFRELNMEETEQLIRRLLKKVGMDLPVDRLLNELIKNNVWSPRLVTQAVEKYTAGADPEDAADVESSTSIDTKHLTRAVVKGDWAAVSDILYDTKVTDMRAIRVSLISYLRKSLLGEKEFTERTDALAMAISELAMLQNAEDKVVAGAVTATLYSVTHHFSIYKR